MKGFASFTSRQWAVIDRMIADMKPRRRNVELERFERMYLNHHPHDPKRDCCKDGWSHGDA